MPINSFVVVNKHMTYVNIFYLDMSRQTIINIAIATVVGTKYM